MGGAEHIHIEPHVAVRMRVADRPYTGRGIAHEQFCAICRYLRCSNHQGTRFVSKAEYERIRELPWAERLAIGRNDG